MSRYFLPYQITEKVGLTRLTTGQAQPSGWLNWTTNIRHKRHGGFRLDQRSPTVGSLTPLHIMGHELVPRANATAGRSMSSCDLPVDMCYLYFVSLVCSVSVTVGMFTGFSGIYIPLTFLYIYFAIGVTFSRHFQSQPHHRE